MPNECLSDDRSQSHRNRVSDQPTQLVEPDRLAGLDELISGRKRLQHRGLTKRYRSILFRMTEPPVPVPVALRSDRWCDLVPFHSPVNTRVGGTAILFVTLSPE